MGSELTFLLALAVTLTASALVIVSLGHALHGVLTDLCGTEKRAGFWTRYAAIVLVLGPLVAVQVGRASGRNSEPLFFQVVDQARWGLFGLVGALVLVALGVVLFAQQRSATVQVSPEQMDDLERLLAKVEEIRARHVLRRAAEREKPGTEPASPAVPSGIQPEQAVRGGD